MSIVQKNILLNMAAEMPASVANGPGTRYVLWVQGCPLRCPKCCNADFQLLKINRLVKVGDMARKIIALPDIEGVTFTGGEPMLQDRALYFLSRELKKQGLSIVCYSGFTLAQLRQRGSEYTDGLLDMTDIFIDGRFDYSRRANLLWRGSSNQRVHFLSDRYAAYRNLVDGELSEMEISVGESGMVITGMLQEKLINRLEQVIGSRK